MPGSLANNSEVLDLIASGDVVIDPFDPDRLKAAHYPLTAFAVFVPVGAKKWAQAHAFDSDGDTFQLEPNQYVIIEVREKVTLAPGILGKFIPSSNLIDQCLGLTAGRVEHPFGQMRETLRFGLKNLATRPTTLDRNDYIAYAEFHDLRATPLRPVQITPRDEDIYERRRVDEKRYARAKDDGVFYSTDDVDAE